jgi:hypothetical protein
MIKDYTTNSRGLKQVQIDADFVITGGGLAGTCAAVTAARKGLSVILIQDRPVLGGNCSSEVRLWVLGATSHMGNNNRWAREGGLIDEIMLENAYCNPDGNPIIFDTILLEKVVKESNITLLLNTAVYDLKKSSADSIESVSAFCSQNSTMYQLNAPLFCDASGDGIVGFIAGAAFRMGAESKEEFGEKFAPDQGYGELLGHSIYFYSKDVGRPVKFVPPSYALKDITEIPRYRNFKTQDYGCRLWWLEYGGRLDTIHESENIKWELWKVVYGVWDYIKNSGDFPDAQNMTLEWVGNIPGKRESRRFEGDYMLRQQDIVEQTRFNETVAFGGWSIDLHPADGVYSEKSGCNQWHGKGIFEIPYLCYYSRNINNLFLAGRIISASHVAFGSTRVMATNAHGAQAVAMAAYLSKKYQATPREIGEKHLTELQQELLKTGHHLPHRSIQDNADLIQQASAITASSSLKLTSIPFDGIWETIEQSVAQLLPLKAGSVPAFSLEVHALEEADLTVQLRISAKPTNHTPEFILDTQTFTLQPGKQTLELRFDAVLDEECYVYITFLKNSLVELPYSNQRVTGILTVFNQINPAVSNYGKQEPLEDIGVDAFEFWSPKRRPLGQNIALTIHDELTCFGVENLRNGVLRPVEKPNAWVAEPADRNPVITISWDNPVTISRIELAFDTDFDHPLENVLIINPETVMPFCADRIEIYDEENNLVASINDNYLSRRTIELEQPVETRELIIRPSNNHSPNVPVALFEIRCY